MHSHVSRGLRHLGNVGKGGLSDSVLLEHPPNDGGYVWGEVHRPAAVWTLDVEVTLWDFVRWDR